MQQSKAYVFFARAVRGWLGQGQDNERFAGHGADVVVQAHHFDAGDLLDHHLHERLRRFDQMGPYLLEQVATKPSFRKAFKSRRCLIAADGFYEWQKAGSKKQPFHIGMKDGRPFGLAGFWENWERDGQEIESCTILTTDANELMAPIHNRMPVILGRGDYDLWLDPAVQEVERIQPLMRPYPPKEMIACAVSTLVNNPRNDVAECLAAGE